MRGVALIFLSSVQVLVMADEASVECRKWHVLPDSSTLSPSLLEDVKVKLVAEWPGYALNISWAVKIDASIEYLRATHIVISGETSRLCEYTPHLRNVIGPKSVTGPKLKWFHYLVSVSEGYVRVQAANLPLSPLGGEGSYKSDKVIVPAEASSPTTTTTAPPPTVLQTSMGLGLEAKMTTSPTTIMKMEHITVTIFGGLVCLMILGFCYIFYKKLGANNTKSLGFKSLPESPAVPVPVLVVYPAENSAFQGAVVALAEFLQWHGGCSVAIDMWQQGKIAELGPMRWLVEQAKAADQVLIVCPQHSSQPCHSPPDHSMPQPSVPAAAHDLYPLILNMVASHAKIASDLNKFWVVQLGKQQDKRPSSLAPELRTCKTFCLMKDLSKLCKSLQTYRKDKKKISDLIFRPGISYCEVKSTVKLREAVEKHLHRDGTTENVCLNIRHENV